MCCSPTMPVFLLNRMYLVTHGTLRFSEMLFI